MRLSIIMANYNHGCYLYIRIKSILEQLLENDEIVIVDDASTDNSIEIIQNIAKDEPRIKLIRNEKNQGVVFSANTALHAAKGQYVASLSADDKILPGFIEKTMDVLQRYPEIAICCSDCGLCYDDVPGIDPDEIYTTILANLKGELHVFSPKKLQNILRSMRFWIPGHTSIIKREALLRHGGFKAELEYLCDWFLIHSIALEEGVAYIPETLSVWRQHLSSYSSTLMQDQSREKRVYGKMLEILALPENRKLRRLFRSSTILQPYLKIILREVIFQVHNWDLLGVVIWKVLKNRIKKLIGSKQIIFLGNK